MFKKYRWLILYLLLLSANVGCDLTSQGRRDRSENKQAQTVLIQPQTSENNTSSSLIGWKTISGNGVMLLLPESYEGGNPSKDIDALAEKLKPIGPNFVEQLKQIKNNVPVVAFFAFDSNVNKAGFLTNINMVVDKVPPGTTIEEYLNTAIQQMNEDYQIIGQKVIPLEQHQAGQIIAQSTSGNVKIKQLIYAIPKDDTFWLITYSTSTDEFEQKLPIFEQSIRTLKFNPS